MFNVCISCLFINLIVFVENKKNNFRELELKIFIFKIKDKNFDFILFNYRERFNFFLKLKENFENIEKFV